jgi:hypothetical protein
MTGFHRSHSLIFPPVRVSDMYLPARLQEHSRLRMDEGGTGPHAFDGLAVLCCVDRESCHRPFQ